MGYYSVGGENVPIINDFPTASGKLYGADKQAAAAAGWTNAYGDVWTNKNKPGVYLDSKSLQSMLSRQGNALAAMDSNNYAPNVDYTAAINPYLNSLNTQYQSASKAIGEGPAAVDMGNEYETRLRQLLDNPDSIQNTGAYKFRFDQGQQAVERSAAARGMTGSGNVLAELAKYGQGMASQAYDTEADRLGTLSGQQKNYLLGLRSAATNDYTAKANALNSLSSSGVQAGRLALDAAMGKSGDYWKAKNMAQQAAQDTGYYTKQAIW